MKTLKASIIVVLVFGHADLGAPRRIRAAGARVENKQVIAIESDLEAVRAEESTKDYPWIPIQMTKCTERCDAYVSDAHGVDAENGGTLEAPFKTLQFAIDQRTVGQTIHVMEGTYKNSKFGEEAKNNPVASLNNVQDLTIQSYSDHKPKIKFDSAGAFVGKNVERVKFQGLEIEGVNAEVSYEQAMAGRLTKEPRLAGRGIAIWRGNHIQFQSMKVHHCPGSGLRVNFGDYVLLSDSEVYSNCWWSSAAESAVVFAEAEAVDELDEVKMIMRRNTVYDNMNKVPYYNSKYAWYKSPIASGKNCKIDACNPDTASFNQRTCPWQCQYGKSYQDYIVDGMGVYVTRNNLASHNYTAGRMELSGNTAYGNGINGLVFHRTDRGAVFNNLIYDNGVVPGNGGKRTEDWQINLGHASGKTDRQPYAGITINNAYGVKLSNNIVSAPSPQDKAYAMEYDAGSEKEPVSSDSKYNKVCRGQSFDASLGPANVFVQPAACTDDGPGYMATKGFTCQTWEWAMKSKCNSNSSWAEKNYCQRSCYLAGKGYSDADNRCCLPHTSR